MNHTLDPLQPHFEDDAIHDARQRLAQTRFPEAETVEDWQQGVPLSYCQELVRYWRDDYDWQRVPNQLAQYENWMTELEGVRIHVVHVRSPHTEAKPLLMTHGWPGSVLEFLEVIGPLTDPTKWGGQPEDAFHLVMPSLPGFGFSAKPTEPGFGIDRIAVMWDALMLRLGYDQYVAQGGDWGSLVTHALLLNDALH